MQDRLRLRARLAFAVMVASGFAGLGYQIVWTQQAALWLGHEAAAVLAVVTAFFGGLAFGAAVLGPRIERAARPERWYAACEALIALWSFALVALMAPVSGWLLRATGAQPHPLWQALLAFGGTFLLLLPATAAMGATLPAMERVLAGLQRRGPSIAALYACNTAGAVLGVLAAAFWLVPAVGLVRTAALCAACNVFCAVAALGLSADRAAGVPPEAPRSAAGGRTLAVLALTGLLGIGYEVLVVRVLSQVTEDTVYTFAILLAVYLVGTTLGAAAHRRSRPAWGDADCARQRLLAALAVACLLGAGGLWAAEGLRNAVQQAIGAGMGGALAAETALAVAAFALPTVVMGALFSELATQARSAGIGFSRALAVNTLGAAAAPPLFGVLLVPALGPKLSLLLVVAAYLALAWPRPVRLRPALALVGGGVLALAVWAPPLAFVEMPEGGRLVNYREGALAAVSVVEDAAGVSRLRIDNRQQEGSSASLLADARQALLPLLLHPAPRRVLFLGLGTGLTAGAAAEDPALQVDAVELLPEVIDASVHFRSAFGSDAPNPRLHLMVADARRYVRTAGPRYDVIVADNFHPARSGSGSLYTVEHFEAVRGRLAAGGLFCQWLPLHQLDLATLRSIVRAFLVAYPGGSAMLATNSLETPVLGLVGRADGGRFDLPRLRARLAGAALPLADFGLDDEWAVLGSLVAGPSALAQLAEGAPLNTDDHPVVAYRAPRITYAPDSLPRERLLALLPQLRAEPAELVDAGADAGALPQLAAYWSARNRFIEAGRSVHASADVREMLAQVRQPLLAVLNISPEFRPAYDPLLRMASALARTDMAAAQALLNELVRLQPARPEAARALSALERAPPGGGAPALTSPSSR
jgi:spermidine synthase